jgi:hypothetical protein
VFFHSGVKGKKKPPEGGFYMLEGRGIMLLLRHPFSLSMQPMHLSHQELISQLESVVKDSFLLLRSEDDVSVPPCSRYSGQSVCYQIRFTWHMAHYDFDA